MKLLDFAIQTTNKYIDEMPKSQRKKYGQFFTSKETAVFMAGLFDVPENKTRLQILDAGAGSGILSIALIERLQEIPQLQYVHLVCYENDSKIIELLRTNLQWVRQHTTLTFDYEIREDNYILSQMFEYNEMICADPNPLKYDMVIGNPPYMKIAKNAPEAKAMPDVCYGAPNLYFLFAAMGMFNLIPNGELVYIIPRSWTSGAYFKRFRQKFLNDGVLEHIHLFVSRDKVFENESVLQETIIIKMRKSTATPASVTITTTQSNRDFSNKTNFEAPYTTVVSGEDTYVYLVTNEQEVETLRLLNRWTNTLPSIGLKMKTGLTVDFRNREVLRDTAEDHAVPLFYSQHIQDGKVIFPIGKEHEYIVTDQLGLLQPNVNYLFVKRFTAKEEHRRLQCGVYLARKYPDYSKISTQNKINFICGLKELSECVVYGLYVLFNSTLYDSYYRILNGSTQVNSTEINSMPVPPLESIELLGKELIKLRDMTEMGCDKILMRKMPVQINGEDFTFSPGKHNELQKAIIEEFAPRFAPNSECLYVGDTTEKDLVKNVAKLQELGFAITLHDKMPDVVLYSEEKNWVYFIESVTSVGPMDPKRIKEIEEMTTGVTAGKIYVTAFLDFKTFKKFSETLAWETEVWIADMPDHMIHLNGDTFLGPRK